MGINRTCRQVPSVNPRRVVNIHRTLVYFKGRKWQRFYGRDYAVTNLIFLFFEKDICLFLAGSRMELLLELHSVNNEGCFYVLLLGLLREDKDHVKFLCYCTFYV